MNKTSVIWAISRENFIEIVNKSDTFSEMLSKFGLLNIGWNYKTLKKRILFENLPLSEIKQKSVDRQYKHRRSIPLKDILKRNSNYPTYNGQYLKKRLIREGLIEDKCTICNMPPIWNSQPIILQLDHINGDTTDHSLENLRVVCPNCHSQTKTYCRKSYTPEKLIRRIKHKQCKYCNKVLHRGTKSFVCSKCISRSREEKRGINKEILGNLLKIKPVEQIGKQFGVTGNAVKKWMKKYGIAPIFKRGDWAKKTQTKQIPPKEELEAIIKKDTLKNIGKRYSVEKRTVSKWLRSYGLTKIPQNKIHFYNTQNSGVAQ